MIDFKNFESGYLNFHQKEGQVLNLNDTEVLQVYLDKDG